MEAVREKIRAFFNKSFQKNIEFDDDQDIFALGFVNSLFAMQLVLFVESEFNISVQDEDLDIENFRSVNAILRLIERQGALSTNV